MIKITAVCLSATIQKTITFKTFSTNEVNRSEKYILNASGKAVNSARVLNQLEKGCCTVICPAGEENKDRFFTLAKQERFPIITVMIPGSTRECWTILDKNQHETTELVISEPVRHTDMSKKTDELMQKISESLATSDALLIAGSRPEIWPEDLSAKICRLGFNMKKIVMVDFWGKDLQRTLEMCTPSIIKINEEEFCGTFHYPFPQNEENLQNFICEESRKLKNSIIVTRGGKCTLAARNGNAFKENVQKVNIVNTTGCGDSFSAGFLYEYLTSGDMQKSLALGTSCAAKNAEKELPGTIE